LQTRQDAENKNGILVSANQAFIGSEGAPGNAKATITVVDGVVGLK